MITFNLKEGKNRKSGKKFFTWQAVHENGNVVNHKYDRKHFRTQMLHSFIDQIQKGKYKIQ